MRDAVFDAADRLICAAAPEREAELHSLWIQYSPTFVLTDDKEGFSLEAGAFGSVIFTNKTLRQIWLLGFASWQALCAYSGVVALLEQLEQPFKRDVVAALPGQQAADAAFDALVADAEKLQMVSDFSHFTWPSDVPEPGKTDFPNVSHRATFDLICIATAYVFLHEVRHVLNATNGASTKDAAEELDCDAFARAFLFDQISTYSGTTGFRKIASGTNARWASR